MILIKSKDEIFLTVDSTEEYEKLELRDFFSIQIPSAKWHPLVRSQQWDGKIRLYNTKTNTLYKGLYPYIDSFCSKRNYEYQSEYDEHNKSQINLPTPKEVYEFSQKTLNPQFQNKPLKLRTHQLLSIYNAIHKEQMLLLSPTASGKSLVIYSVLRWFQNIIEPNKKMLILVPTTALVEQMYNDFKEYSSKDEWNVSENCHRIYSGHDKKSNNQIYISTWQSLYKYTKKYFKDFEFVLLDECHQGKANCIKGTIEKCSNAKYRFGTTGTLDDINTHKLILKGLFIDIYKATTTKEMIDKNEISNLKIKCHILSYNGSEKKMACDFDYHKEIDFIVRHDKRNKKIAQKTLKLEGNTLLLFNFVKKHGEPLYKTIKKMAPKRRIFFIYGGTKTEERERIRQLMKEETHAIIIASYGTCSTGISIRNLHNLIFGSPYKSKIRVLQSIGRGLRLSKNKTSCTVVDYIDDISTEEHINYALKHYIERVKLYCSEGFDYNIYYELL